MNILLTNDDGIHAEGLAALEAIAAEISDDVTIVAPEHEQSGASHSLTLHLPVRVKQYAPKRYSVTGTPTDCVLLAAQSILKKKPTLVLSGVNRGSNVGDDVTYSGTVAGAMEACVLGIPSIALSQLGRGDDANFAVAEKHAPAILRQLIKQQLPLGSFWNVNFPATLPSKVKGVRVAPQGKREVSIAFHERMDPKKRPYFWLGGERSNKANKNSDVELLQQGYITITPLKIDITDYASLEKFANIL